MATDFSEVDSMVTDIYQDLRAASRPAQRLRKQSRKYYGFRCVKPAMIGNTYCCVEPTAEDFSSHFFGVTSPHDPYFLYHPETLRIFDFTKRDMLKWCDIDIWPLDCRHHVGKRIRDRRNNKRNLEFMERKIKQKVHALSFAQEYPGLDIEDQLQDDRKIGTQSHADFPSGDEHPSMVVPQVVQLGTTETTSDEDDEDAETMTSSTDSFGAFDAEILDSDVLSDVEYDVLSIASSDDGWDLMTNQSDE